MVKALANVVDVVLKLTSDPVIVALPVPAIVSGDVVLILTVPLWKFSRPAPLTSAKPVRVRSPLKVSVAPDDTA